MSDTIRMADARDASEIAAIYAPFCTDSAVSFELTAPTAEEMAARIQKITERYPWLVLEREGQIAGYVYASPYRDRAAYQWTVDVTAYIAEGFRGQGVGKTLYTVLFDLLRRQGFYNAYAGIALPNPASIGLHESMGFELIGVYRHVGYKMGAWHDVAWYGLSLQPPQGEPDVPKSINEVLPQTT